MSIFASAKDRLIEQAALSYLNSNLLVPFGRAIDLRIDSKAKSLSIELELKGDAMPVKIDINRFEIFHEGDRHFIVVQEADTSREWLTALANTQLCGRRFELPAQAGSWLSRMF